MLLRWLKQLAKTENGSAAVEFAILLPLLIALTAGCIEFGKALWEQQLLEKGARDAARFASRYPDLTASPGTICPSNSSANVATVTDVAQNLVLYADPCGSGTPLISNMTPNEISITSTTFDTNTTPDVTGPLVTVTISVPYAQIGLLGLLGLTPPTLSTTYEQRECGTASGDLSCY